MTTQRHSVWQSNLGLAKPLWRRPQAAMVCLLFACCGWLAGGPVGAQDDEVLKNMPWYDAQQSEVKAMPLDELDDSGARHRNSNWIHQPANSKTGQPNATATGAGRGGAQAPSWLSTAVSWLIWILVGALCLALLTWITWLLVKQEWRAKSNEEMGDWEKDLSLDPARIEALPFDVAAPQGDLLAQARQAQAEGRFRDAIIYLFSYMLLKLDKHHWIRLTKGKTNRTYLRELRNQRDLQQLLERTVISFEDVFFGDLPMEPSEFQARWGDLDQFHRLVEARQS